MDEQSTIRCIFMDSEIYAELSGEIILKSPM